MMTLHFLRPYWLFGFLILFTLVLYWLKKPASLRTLQHICDTHLLPHLIQTTATQSRKIWVFPVISLSFILVSLSGPAFVKLPVPIFKSERAHVVVADFSSTMLAEDIVPNRLQRANLNFMIYFKKKITVGNLALLSTPVRLSSQHHSLMTHTPSIHC